MKNTFLMRAAVLFVCAALIVCSFAGCGGTDTAASGGNSTSGAVTSSSEIGNTAVENTGEKITLIASSSLAANNFQALGSFVPWMDYITEQTNGQVEFIYYNSGELTPFGEDYDSLREGICDISLALNANLDSSRFLLSDIYSLPIFGGDVDTVYHAICKLMESDVKLGDSGMTFYEYEYGSKGLVSFPAYPNDTLAIATTKKDLADINTYSTATTIRTSTRENTFVTEGLGFAPVTISITDSYDALNRGALDGMCFPVDWQNYGIDTLLGYAVRGVALGFSTNMMSMKQETWDSLPEDIQEVFREACNHMDGYNATMANSNANWDSLNANGATIYEFNELPQEIQDLYTNACANVWFNMIDVLSETGAPAKEAAIVYRDILLELGVDLPDSLMQLESYVPNT